MPRRRSLYESIRASREEPQPGSRLSILKSGESLWCDGWILPVRSTRARLEVWLRCILLIASGKSGRPEFHALGTHSSGCSRSGDSSSATFKGSCSCPDWLSETMLRRQDYDPQPIYVHQYARVRKHRLRQVGTGLAGNSRSTARGDRVPATVRKNLEGSAVTGGPGCSGSLWVSLLPSLAR